MSSFGGESLKPMVLFSNAPWIGDVLEFAQPATPTKRLAELNPDGATGELRPRGGPELKESQAYTYEFGAALAESFASRRKDWRNAGPPRRVCKCTSCPDAFDVLTEPPSSSDDLWPDAQMFDVLSTARAAARAVMPDVLVEFVVRLD